MIRIGRRRIICAVATVAGIRRGGIVTLVTSIAIIRNRNVRACKRINGIVVKGRWRPSRLCVACGTFRWELRRSVVWIGCGGIIRIVATIAGVRRIGIVAVVTSVAIVGNRHVRAYEWINRIVVKRRWRPGSFTVAGRAICWELSGCVVRRCGCCIVAVVTGVAGVWCIRIVTIVASVTIVGNRCVRPI